MNDWMSDAMMRRAMLDSAVGMGLMDPAGEFRRVNRALCEMVGLEAEELHRMHWSDIVVPDDTARVDVLLEQVLNGTLDRFETRLRLQYPDGTPRHARCTLSAVRDGSGQVEMLWLQAIDIARENLLDETLRLLASQGSDVMVRADNNGSIVWVSPNVQGSTGWRQGQLEGSPFISLIHPEDREMVRVAQTHLLEGQSQRLRVRLMRADGRFERLAIQVDPIFAPGGEVTGRMATWRREPR